MSPARPSWNPFAVLVPIVAVDAVLILVNLMQLAPSFLDLDQEKNFPTWYSSTKLLCCGLLALWFGFRDRRDGATGISRFTWPAMGALFVALSLDETATAHERLAGWVMARFGGDSLRDRLLGGDAAKDAFAWPVLFAPVILFVLYFLVTGLYGKLRGNRRSLLLGLAGCAAFLAAVLLEGPAVYSSPPIEAWGESEIRRYSLFVALEESAEVLGTTLMLAALLLHARWLDAPAQDSGGLR